MLSFSQIKALKIGNEVHYGTCRCHKGPRGGLSLFISRWRVNGKLFVRQRDFSYRLPIKQGLWGFGAITPFNFECFHLPSECPALAEFAAAQSKKE